MAIECVDCIVGVLPVYISNQLAFCTGFGYVKSTHKDQEEPPGSNPYNAVYAFVSFLPTNMRASRVASALPSSLTASFSFLYGWNLWILFPSARSSMKWSIGLVNSSRASIFPTRLLTALSSCLHSSCSCFFAASLLGVLVSWVILVLGLVLWWFQAGVGLGGRPYEMLMLSIER